MNAIWGTIDDLRNALGWVVDASVAVCLHTAGWTAPFLSLTVYDPGGRQIAVAPRSLSNRSTETRDEFATQLDSIDLALWQSADGHIPGGIVASFQDDAVLQIQGIIRRSRHSGRSISRADAEGIYLAGLYQYALLTGDNRQAAIAISNGVAVIHKSTVLEMMAQYADLPPAQLCDGLAALIANSNRDDPCALSDDRRNRLRAIYRRQCPGADIAI